MTTEQCRTKAAALLEEAERMPERGRFEVTGATELAALVSESGGGRIRSLGAGTRISRSDTSAPTLTLSA